MDIRLDDPVRAQVGRADHQAERAVARADDHVAGESHARSGARELREYQAGHQREREQSGQRLDRDQDVREQRDRLHLAVTDRRHRLHAEKKHVGERAGARILDSLVEVVAGREQQIGEREGGGDQADQRGPRRRHQEVVEVLENAGGRAVNRTVALQAAELDSVASPSRRNIAEHASRRQQGLVLPFWAKRRNPVSWMRAQDPKRSSVLNRARKMRASGRRPLSTRRRPGAGLLCPCRDRRRS